MKPKQPERDFALNTGPENLTKSRTKKLVKSNKSISQNPFFAISKMAKNQFLRWENVSNYQKCNFTKKKFLIYLISRFFLPGIFTYSGPLYRIGTYLIASIIPKPIITQFEAC